MQQPLFTDSFTRSDAALNSTAFPSIFGAASLGVVSNVVKFDNTGGHMLGYNQPTPNYTVEGVFKIDATDDQCGAVSVMARYNSSSGAHYGLVWGKAASTHPHQGAFAIAADTVYLVKSTGSVVTSLASASKSFTANTNWRLRIAVCGSSIQGYINDLLVVSATDTTYITPLRPAFGHIRKTSGGSTNLVTFDNFFVNPFDVFVNMQVAEDEATSVIKWSLPTDGSAGMQKLLCYCEATGDFFVEDVATSCLFTLLQPDNRRRIVYGNPSDGKLYLFDDSTKTREGAAFTGTWRSNWLKIDSALKRRNIVHRVRHLVSLAEANALEVSVEVADDPDDPTTVTTYHPISGYHANEFWEVGQRGNFVRVSVAHAASTGELRLRGIDIELLVQGGGL